MTAILNQPRFEWPTQPLRGLPLRADQLIAITDRPRTATIHCLQGELWITQAGVELDVVIRTGESFEPTRSGKVVVQALTDSTVLIDHRRL